MGHINLEDVKRFAGESVELSILDLDGGDQAPTIQKTIKKVQLCPDQTHVRFYFDDIYFLAVPLVSEVTETVEKWAASDKESGLTYVIKKV
ncbi:MULTISPECIES: hypothetical protein [Bacillaceae]|uniref:hypothetical protein n=1 Tax=Bacillaceae TaxID=186817 RepID=UPI002FFE10A2